MQNRKSARNGKVGNGRALRDKRSMDRGAERARQAVEGPEGPVLREAEKRAKSGPSTSKRAQSR